MARRSKDHQAWLIEKLTDPARAADYLNAAHEDSPEMFLEALRDVAQARQMAKVAREAGITRESLYRATSEIGNPTLETFREVLKAVGVKFHFEPITEAFIASTPPVSTTPLSMSGLTSSKLETINSDSLSNSGELSFGPFLAYVNPNPPSPKFRPGANREPSLGLRNSHYGRH